MNERKKITSLIVCGTLLVSMFAAIAAYVPAVVAPHVLPGDLRTLIITVARVDIVHHTAIASSCTITPLPSCGVLDPGPGQVITISTTVQSFDLLQAQGGLLLVLGIAALPDPGFITQFRLVVTSAVIELDGFRAPVSIPSGVIKFDGIFEKSRDVDAVFDFDPEKSLISNAGQGFMLKGVIEFCAVPSGCPDLIVESLTHSPQNPTTTDMITFTAVVKNIGAAIAGKSTLNFRVGGETFGENFPIPFLLPGGFVTVERQLVLNVAQNYQNTVTADVDDEVAECFGIQCFEEGNNVTIDLYTVT